MFVSVIYRPPDAELINCDLDEVFKRHSVGFNANMLVTTSESTFVKQLACQLNLKLVEHGATNHQNKESHTWIDIILVNDDGVVINSNNMAATFRNSHNIIDVVIGFPTSVKPMSSSRTAISKRFDRRSFCRI